jgi:hypothetical protein
VLKKKIKKIKLLASPLGGQDAYLPHLSPLKKLESHLFLKPF